MACMQKLSADTIRLITSSQVITSVVSVVKELTENSLDAGSDNIEVKLENYGFDKIEVRDNGTGIKPADAPYMARRHFTSKISQHSDLESLATYGFRGEALGSLCAVSLVTIVTKTQDDEFGRQYQLDHEGGIVGSKPSHQGNGTAVTATHLFKNVPVRKQYYTNAKRQRDELKKVEDLIMSYGAIRPAVRFSISHNKSVLWQKCKVANHKAALISTWGASVMSQMQYMQKLDKDTEIRIEGFVPTLSADYQSATRVLPDRCWIAINGRPITFKEVEKMVKQSYCQAVKRETSSVRHLIIFLSITLPQYQVDVNLEPNKTKVLLQNKESMLSVLSDLLDEVYGRAPDDHTTGTIAKISTHERVNYVPNIETIDSMPKPIAPDDKSLCNEDVVCEDNTDSCSKEKLDCEIENGVLHQKNLGRPSHQDQDHDGPECKASEEAKESAETSTDSNVPLTPDPPRASSDQSVSASQAPSDFELNFSIFDDDLHLEGLNETLTDCDLGEVKTPENEFVNQHVSEKAEKATSDTSLTGDTAENVKTVTTSVSLEDWSRGSGLTHKDSENLESATLLIPRNSNEDTSVTIRPEQLSANQRVENTESQKTTYCTLNSNPTNQKNTLNLLTSVTPGNSTATQETGSPAANRKRSPSKRRLFLEKKMGKGTMYDLIGGSPIRRPMSSYELFCKDMRPQVLEENPSFSFNDITRIVAEKWRQLEEQERAKYEEKARKDTERHHNQMQAARNKLGLKDEINLDAPPSKKQKTTTVPSNQGLIDKMLLSQQQRKAASQHAGSEVPDIPTLDVSFSLTGLKRELETHHKNSESVPDEGVNLIGQFASHGVWLAHHGNQVVIFNQYRVEEMLLYHRLMMHHVLPCQPLDVPIVLSPSMLGGDGNWNTLLKMSKRIDLPDPAMYFIDTRLTANGFKLKQTIDSETTEVRVQVIAMATTISCYGIYDLQEILELVAAEQSRPLVQCRPLKVTNYLKGEAVRMARNMSSSMEIQDVEDVIERMKQLPKQCKTCLHNQPFEYPLCIVP
ncbi:PMS1 protein homolog 1-like [Acanthaster planci]|uniref:PMS1 protein homolog 1-like n=1 Tax=Acanthaster planci TaxID=133434 RepID=A0A8B7Z0G0_ACAPL|nr:PMS1 protein homolog 1-like [Acanthaster planci]XP_022099090.1 PMS1 protein homolog 1-like [Acanthaster planci]